MRSAARRQRRSPAQRDQRLSQTTEAAACGVSPWPSSVQACRCWEGSHNFQRTNQAAEMLHGGAQLPKTVRRAIRAQLAGSHMQGSKWLPNKMQATGPLWWRLGRSLVVALVLLRLIQPAGGAKQSA